MIHEPLTVPIDISDVVFFVGACAENSAAIVATPRKRCSWVDANDPLFLAYHDQEWGVPRIATVSTSRCSYCRGHRLD